MKFTYKALCSCGGQILFSVRGDKRFEQGRCSSCGNRPTLIDPLSVSVTAERLLLRSRDELDDGDYSLSIVIAAMAVESYLTRLFLKLKGMDNYSATFQLPTEQMEEQWEKEYPRSGGFLKPSNFVADKFTGLTFDEFVMSNNLVAGNAFLSLPNPSGLLPAMYFQTQLFRRRNRIAHWGYVNSSLQEAEICHRAATAILTILREMDRLKYAQV